MSVVTSKSRYPRILLIGSFAFFAVSLAFAWPKATPEATSEGAAASVQAQRTQAIAEAQAKGEKTYSYRSSFNPNSPGSR